MTEKLRSIRRVVTGNDEYGPLARALRRRGAQRQPGAVSSSAGMTDVWVSTAPRVISGERDDGNLPFHFEPPEYGGHLRIVQSAGRPKDTIPHATLPPCRCTRRGGDGRHLDRGGQTPTARRPQVADRRLTASCSKRSACCFWTTVSGDETGESWQLATGTADQSGEREPDGLRHMGGKPEE